MKNNSIGCLLQKHQTSNYNFFIVDKYEASTKDFQWIWDYEKTVKYHVSFIDSAELPRLCYASKGSVGWKDWKLITGCSEDGSVDEYYVSNYLVYDVVGDLLRRNNKLSKKITFNSSQVFEIVGKSLRNFLLTHTSIRDKSFVIQGLNTMSAITLKKRSTAKSQVLRFPDLSTEQTRQLLSVDKDYGWVRNGRYVYLGQICGLSFSFKTFILSMKVNIKRVIFNGRIYPFASIF